MVSKLNDSKGTDGRARKTCSERFMEPMSKGARNLSGLDAGEADGAAEAERMNLRRGVN